MFEIVHSDSVVVIPVEYHWLVDGYWTNLRSTPSMDRMTTKTALITGANKGIGSAIAHGLGMQGIRVGVGARNDVRRQDAVDKLRAAGIDAFGVLSMSPPTTALLPPPPRSTTWTHW